jgi:N-acetyl-1-D-myo-inositol-2-amino-2-deoxy-alpha-D-glucopyranoside deacetylase
VTLTTAPRLLLVHAHPDDESLWTGGTIARYAAAGAHVTVVTCTLGEEGEVIPASLRLLAPSEADQLGGYRVGELRAACAALGVSDHRFLGGAGRWRDSGMAGTPANDHPRALVRGDRAEQIDALATILAEVRPQVVVTYGPDGGYGHPDHIAAHQITMAAGAEASYVDRVFHVVTSKRATEDGTAALSQMDDLPFRLPAPGELPMTDDSEITTVVPIAEVLPEKLAAMRAHATQISVWEGQNGERCYALSNGIAQPVVAAEYYILVAGDKAGIETDLFGGVGQVER